MQDEIGTAFEKRYKEKFGANAGHNSGAQSYDGAYVWATAAALAGGSGEPGNEEQNRKVAARMRAMIHRGVTGTTRFIPDEQAAYTYPTQVADSSLGMPHQFLQIQDHTKGGGADRAGALRHRQLRDCRPGSRRDRGIWENVNDDCCRRPLALLPQCEQAFRGAGGGQ